MRSRTRPVQGNIQTRARLLHDMTRASDVKACPECGSAHLGVPGLRDGITPVADVMAYKCLECDWVGVPVMFATEEERLAFVEEIAGGKDS